MSLPVLLPEGRCNFLRRKTAREGSLEAKNCSQVDVPGSQEAPAGGEDQFTIAVEPDPLVTQPYLCVYTIEGDVALSPASSSKTAVPQSPRLHRFSV